MPETNPTKYCPKCKHILPISDFHKSRSTKDGLYGWCGKCQNASTRAYWATPKGKKIHRETVRKYERTNKGKETHRRYNQSKKGIISKRKRVRRHRLKYPEKIVCRNATNCAVEMGRISPANHFKCKCGKQAEDYHHLDYSKPYDIIPMCRLCHVRLHLDASPV